MKKIKNKEKENMKRLDTDNLLEVLLTIFEDKFKEKYGIDFNSLLLEKEAIRKCIGEKVKIPVSIFREELGASEVLCRYLKDYEKLKFSEIAKLINRDQRTVAINYHNSVRKKADVKFSKKGVLIPVSIFAERELSILEVVVDYLKNKNYKNFEIAEWLNKDPRNISTLYSRIKKKRSRRVEG